MVFESQHPGRRAQNMAALLGLIIMLGILLPIPIGAGFADWMNSTTAPSNLDDKFVALDPDLYNLLGDEALKTTGDYTPYFYWYNSSDSPENQVNVTMENGTLTTGDALSVDENNAYDLSATGDAAVDWEQGTPYWEVYLDYTPRQMYDDNIVKIGIQMTSPDAANAPNNVTDGKNLLSYPQLPMDEDDFNTVTVTLSAGGVDLFSANVLTDGNGKVNDNATIDVTALRSAIMTGGDDYIMLKITGHDIRDVNMTGSAFYTYNTTKLFNRDDGLYVTSMVSIIMAALGIFLVQPRWNLPLGGNTRQGGRRRF